MQPAQGCRYVQAFQAPPSQTTVAIHGHVHDHVFSFLEAWSEGPPHLMTAFDFCEIMAS